jgi:hypothetical protein
MAFVSNSLLWAIRDHLPYTGVPGLYGILINPITGTVLVGAVFVVLVNIEVDVAQPWLHPRIRLV